MSVNVGIFEDAALTTQYSVDKVPYEIGYYPVFHGESFNATDGEAKNKVIYLNEINANADYYYDQVQVAPVETAANQRDPDNDGTNEFHIFISPPVEHAVSGEAVGTGDGTTTEFDLANKWLKPGSETLKLGTTVQTRNTDYWINYKEGHIRFATAPGNGVDITIDYTHGDDGTGNVDIPAEADIEANGDWVWTDVWEIPHGEDSDRGTGYEKDGIPVIVRAKVYPGTTDANGNAVTLADIDIKVKGWEHQAKL